MMMILVNLQDYLRLAVYLGLNSVQASSVVAPNLKVLRGLWEPVVSQLCLWVWLDSEAFDSCLLICQWFLPRQCTFFEMIRFLFMTLEIGSFLPRLRLVLWFLRIQSHRGFEYILHQLLGAIDQVGWSYLGPWYELYLFEQQVPSLDPSLYLYCSLCL